MLEITYKNKNVKEYCENPRRVQKDYGAQLAAKLSQRIDDLKSLNSIYELLECGIDNPHLLKHDLEGCIGWDLTSHIRLIIKFCEMFSADIVEKSKNITTATIEGVRDYHGGNKRWLIN